MDSWGVTEKGFYRPTLEDIITEKNKKAKELFGNDFSTDGKTPQGKMLRVNAAAENKLCEIAEGLYYCIFPSTARGISLDRVCEFANLTRESAGYAVHTLKVYGKQDYVIEAGTKFKNNAGLEFYSTQPSVINNVEEAGEGTSYIYALVTVQCTQSGEVGNVQNINATSEVDTNINTVEYLGTIAYGTEVESDPELREKFTYAVSGLGTNTTASIKANVIRLAGVNDVIIVDNNTDSDMVLSDALTVAKHSYAIIVQSDDLTIGNEIATAIFEKQPFGIMQSGIESEIVKDDSGVEHTVKFSYVEPVDVDISVECTVDNTFSSNGENEIINNISSYIDSLGIGEEVVFSRLYDYIYNVTGVYKVTNITLNGANNDIPISSINYSRTGTITVDVTEV